MIKIQLCFRLSTFEHYTIFQLNKNYFITLSRFYRVFFYITHMQKLQTFAIQIREFFLKFMFIADTFKLLIEQFREFVRAVLTKITRILFSLFILFSNENKEYTTIARFDIMYICAI